MYIYILIYHMLTTPIYSPHSLRNRCSLSPVNLIFCAFDLFFFCIGPFSRVGERKVCTIEPNLQQTHIELLSFFPVILNYSSLFLRFFRASSSSFFTKKSKNAQVSPSQVLLRRTSVGLVSGHYCSRNVCRQNFEQ